MGNWDWEQQFVRDCPTGRQLLTGARTGPARRRPALLLGISLFFAILFALHPAGPAVAETRIALVIGVSAYQNAPVLTNPVNDAQAIGDALRRLNFEVEDLRNPDSRALTRGIRDFGIRAQKAETALIYYAGHGVQVDGENYLIPVDAKLERTRDLVYEALPLSLMLDEVSQASKIGIVLLDSCRNNPFIDRVARSMSVAGRAVTTTSGLARVDNVPGNTIVVMAAKAGQIAEDGVGHSPFAAAILAHFQIPGLELGLFFRSVRDSVLKATQNRQEPYVFSSLGAEPFYFYPRPPNRPPTIGPIPTLKVAEIAGATLLGIPAPTDPDLDPLSVRIVGMPRSGEVRVGDRRATVGEAYSVDHFMKATYTPDGMTVGPIGTLDILVEDGRGGSVMGSLPIVVLPSSTPPAVAPAQSASAPPTASAPPPAKPPAPTTESASVATSPTAPITTPAPSPAKTTALTGAQATKAPPQADPLRSQPDLAAMPTTEAGSAATPAPPAASLPPSSAKADASANLTFEFPPLRPALPAPMPSARPGLAEARALATEVPCALLDVREEPSLEGGGRLSVSGSTLPGPAFNAFMHQLDGPAGPAASAVQRLDRGHCPVLAVMTDLVRRNRKRGDLRLLVQNAPISVGGHLRAIVQGVPDGALYVDLYSAEGMVQHLQRGHFARSADGNDVSVTAPASGPAGLRLLVAMSTPSPLDLEKRPTSESDADYLPALRQELAHLTPGAREPIGEVFPLFIMAAPRPPAAAPIASEHVRLPGPPNGPRCADIVARVQLGQDMSDADRKVLQTACGR